MCETPFVAIWRLRWQRTQLYFSARFHIVLVQPSKRQSEHVEQLLTCALLLRRISKTVQCLLNAYSKVPSINFNFLSMLAPIGAKKVGAKSRAFHHVSFCPHTMKGGRERSIRRISQTEQLSVTIFQSVLVSKPKCTECNLVANRRWPCMVPVTS